MATVSVFSNFFIDTPERLQRMKDSYTSFCDISPKEWVINIRGRFAAEASSFLQSSITDHLYIFNYDSPMGWFHDSRKMLSHISSDITLFWLEDHLNLAPIAKLNLCISEMASQSLDLMMYSFWWNGALRDRYRSIELNTGTNIDWFTLTVSQNTRIQEDNPEGVFIIAAPSFFKTQLFKDIVLSDDPLPPRWPTMTPFDFEKGPNDIHWLPLKVGLPKSELFASIDDDHVHPGSCLISRGIYPKREERSSYTFSSSYSRFSLISYLKSLVPILKR